MKYLIVGSVGVPVEPVLPPSPLPPVPLPVSPEEPPPVAALEPVGDVHCSTALFSWQLI